MAGITKSTDIQIKGRESLFVSNFQYKLSGLADLFGISAKRKLNPGEKLKLIDVTVELEDSPAEGEATPRSKATVTEKYTKDIEIKRYAKETTIQAVQQSGYDMAIAKPDEEFENKILNKFRADLFEGLKQGTAEVSATSFKEAVALGVGTVKNNFAAIDRDPGPIIGFANIMDAAKYLADAELQTQTNYGLDYLEKFIGVDKLFLLPESLVPGQTMTFTPANNLQLVYMDVANSEFAKMGLDYTMDNMTNIIGAAIVPDYDKATSVLYAITGYTIWPETDNGIAKVTFTGGYQALSAAGGTPVATTKTTTKTSDKTSE